MKAEDGTGGKNSGSQESKKDTRVSSSKLSSLPNIPKRNSRQKLARTREKQRSKALLREAKQLFNLPARMAVPKMAKNGFKSGLSIVVLWICLMSVFCLC